MFLALKLAALIQHFSHRYTRYLFRPVLGICPKNSAQRAHAQLVEYVCRCDGVEILAFAFQLNGYIESKTLSRAHIFTCTEKCDSSGAVEVEPNFRTALAERLERAFFVRPATEKLHHHLYGTEVKVNSTNRKIWPARDEKHLTEQENMPRTFRCSSHVVFPLSARCTHTATHAVL